MNSPTTASDARLGDGEILMLERLALHCCVPCRVVDPWRDVGRNANQINDVRAGDLTQAFGLCLDRIEHLFKGTHQLFGVDWPNATNHAGAEVFLDAVERSRLRGLQKFRLKLLARS